jgi:hypothetical protein
MAIAEGGTLSSTTHPCRADSGGAARAIGRGHHLSRKLLLQDSFAMIF